MDDKKFEELLEKAFEIHQYNEISGEPSDVELLEAAPFTDKQLEDVKKMCQKEKKPAWAKYVSRAAAIAVCVCLTGFGLMMTNPVIRATVTENIVKCIESGFNIDFTEAEDDKNINIGKTVIGYIPKGFELINDRTEKSAERLSYSYMNSVSEYIVIDIIESSDIELVTEGKHHDLKYIDINGYTGYISYSDIQEQGSVYFGNSSFTVAISGMTEREELIEIAENIIIKG